jgi:hypothetical protein
MVTRDTGALHEELKSEFIESGALGFAPLPRVTLERSARPGNLRRRHTRDAHAKVNTIPNFRHPIAKKQDDSSPRLRLEMTFSIPEKTR